MKYYSTIHAPEGIYFNSNTQINEENWFEVTFRHCTEEILPIVGLCCICLHVFVMSFKRNNDVTPSQLTSFCSSIVIDRKHFIKYWPVWFEHCGYMWHICLPNASQSHVICPIGWFNIVYQARHHMSLKQFLWKCHAENVFKNVLEHTIWSVYGWIP